MPERGAAVAVANGRLNTKFLTAIPAAYHTHGTTAYLQADAADAFLRVAAAFQARFGKRLVAMSFYRPHADQVRIFLKNYYKVSRARYKKTDRSYNGSTYALRSGMAPVASPGYSNHGLGITVDFNSGVQTRYSAEHNWMLSEGTKYGWDWTEGKRIGEPWHWSYNSSKDRMKGAAIAPTPAKPYAPPVVVADVAETQEQLAALGYSPGPVDGSLGPSTRTAVTTYQKDRGLAADGSPGPTTRKALSADMATLNDLEKKVDRLIAFGEQNQWRLDNLPAKVLDAPVKLKGEGWEGKTATLRGIREWYAADAAAIKKLIVSQWISDAEVARIADAVIARLPKGE